MAIIDISEHNSKVKIKTLRDKYSIEGVIIRYSWGNFTKDKQADRFISECLENNMPFSFYHFSYSRSYKDALDAAKKFVNSIKDYNISYPAVVDIESDPWKTQRGVTFKDEADVIRAWRDVFNSYGMRLMVYLNSNYYNNLLKVDSSLFNGLDIWIANWSKEPNDINYYLWQYTSSYNYEGVRLDANQKGPAFKLYNNKYENEEQIDTPFKSGDLVTFNNLGDDRLGKPFTYNTYEVIGVTKEGYVNLGIKGRYVATTDSYRLMEV